MLEVLVRAMYVCHIFDFAKHLVQGTKYLLHVIVFYGQPLINGGSSKFLKSLFFLG